MSFIAEPHLGLATTKAMTQAHGRPNVRVNCICPSDVNTPIAGEAIKSNFAISLISVTLLGSLRTIAMTTTNRTQAFKACSAAQRIYAGAFILSLGDGV
jgi:NAD(P)-dependent dehydrogenase (short-subunit alcohol dehydrogenase family)